MSDTAHDPRSLLTLDGTVAVVTGAGSGIGRRVAETLAACGARVCCSDLDAETAQHTAATLREHGGDSIACRTDATNPAALGTLFADVYAWAGGCDVVVANAGRMSHGDIRSTAAEEFERSLRANLTSAFLTCQAALPLLECSPAGRLVLLSSGAATDPHTVAGLPYAVAKAGISHLTRLLAVQLAGTGVTVNAIAPGAVDTPMAQGFGSDVLSEIADRSPLGRIGTPDDVARAVLFLVSTLGEFVNGEVLRVAGGP